jgi:hypothetical protein
MENHLTHDARSRWSRWILGCVLPARDVDVVMGDLIEEHAVRSRSTAAARASQWYWGQICRSIPPLLWASVQQGGWLSTLGVALGACIVQAIVELTSKLAISSLFAPDAGLGPLTLMVTLPTLVLVSYFAARIRPGAAIVMAALVVVAVVVQLAVKGDQLPIGGQIAALFIGPMAAFSGGVLSLKRTTR